MLLILCVLLFYRNFSFRDIYVDGPRNMARIAKECGVERFIHFSSLNSANPQDHRVILKTGSLSLAAKVWTHNFSIFSSAVFKENI